MFNKPASVVGLMNKFPCLATAEGVTKFIVVEFLYLQSLLLTFEAMVFLCNEGISAARFWHQVASWVPDMFCKFYLVKSHIIANNSSMTEAREK